MNNYLFRKKYPIIIRISSCFILMIYFLTIFSGLSFANPISVDRNNDMCPVPYNNTKVFLKSERIEVTMNDKAHVKAYYVFKNDAENSTEITILLPFISKPSNLRLLLNGKELEYHWTELPPNIVVTRNYGSEITERLVSISFSLHFYRNESKTIFVKYDRIYKKYDFYGNDKIYYSFIYLVSTARYWAHPIESAEFIFRVPENRFDELRSEDYQVEKKNGFIIATKHFENETFESDEIKFYWAKDKDAFWCEENRAICLLLILITIAIPSGIFYGIYKNCKLRDQRRDGMT